MTFLHVLPVVTSFLLLSAHFFRGGQLTLAVVSFLLPLLLAVRRSWIPRIVQLSLLLGSIEWVLTLVEIASKRSEAGQPVIRLIVILVAVALFTALSGLVFRTSRLRERFNIPTQLPLP